MVDFPNSNIVHIYIIYFPKIVSIILLGKELFPNIYVENLSNYQDVIKLQRLALKSRFEKNNYIENSYNSIFDDYADFDETELY